MLCLRVFFASTLLCSSISSDYLKNSTKNISFRSSKNDTSIENFAQNDKCHKGEFPFVVSIQLKINSALVHFCAGSIYNSKTVVSTAHCFEDLSHQQTVFVTAGTVSIDHKDGSEQISPVKRIVMHNLYRKQSENRIGSTFLK